MKHYGLDIAEGSEITNLTAPTGTVFPALPNKGEIFFRSDTNILYVYNGTAWTSELTTPWITSGTDVYYTNGNVGIGNSSLETWSFNSSALQISSQFNLSGTSAGYNSIANNAYNGTGWTYQNTSQATLYETDPTGNHYFHVAPVGTADTAITWTTAMTIDNSSNVIKNGSLGNITLSNNGARIDFSRPGTNYIQATNASGSLDFASGGVSGRIRIDANGNVGIGTITPTDKLHLYSSSGVTRIRMTNDTTSSYVGMDSTDAAMQLATDDFIKFQTGAGFPERMRIDANGKVGIGTSTPTEKLHIVGAVKQDLVSNTGIYQEKDGGYILNSGKNYSDVSWNGSYFIASRARGTQAAPSAVTNGDSLLILAGRAHDGTSFSSLDNAYISFQAGETHSPTSKATQIIFGTTAVGSTSSSEKMRIDRYGNVGIGNGTLENWQSGYKALQLGGNASLAASKNGGAGGTFITAQNAYVGATQDLYQDTDQASRYFQQNGEHTFQVAPSGTADTAITWTTAMTATNSGKVSVPYGIMEAIGTSATFKVHDFGIVADDATVSFTTGSGVAFVLVLTNSGSDAGTIGVTVYNGAFPTKHFGDSQGFTWAFGITNPDVDGKYSLYSSDGNNVFIKNRTGTSRHISALSFCY